MRKISKIYLISGCCLDIFLKPWKLPSLKIVVIEKYPKKSRDSEMPYKGKKTNDMRPIKKIVHLHIHNQWRIHQTYNNLHGWWYIFYYFFKSFYAHEIL